MLNAQNTEKALATRAAAAVGSSLSSKASYGAAAGTAYFGFELEAWGVIVGIVVAVLTLLMNFYYQRKKYNLDVLLAQSQLEKIATATVDENQRVLMDKVRDELIKEFGNVNKRENGDRRKNSNPNYDGVERRKGIRRKSVTGDTETAKALSIVANITQNAVKELDKRAESDGD